MSEVSRAPTLDPQPNMPLQFEAFDVESGAFAYPDDCYDGLLAEFDGLLDGHQSVNSTTPISRGAESAAN